jgi:hypothetical protein
MALLQKAYLGATPLFRATSFFEDDTFAVVNSTAGATVTADSSAHTKGAWTELVASTSANSSLLIIGVNAFASTIDTSTLLDIGAGASGSESVLVGDIAVGGHATVNTNVSCYFGLPIKIASGTRVSARIQSLVTGGKTATVRVYLIDAEDYAIAPTTVDVIGTDTATSTGTLMSGASGTWVEVVASTSQAYRAVVVVPSASSAALGNTTIQYNLGTGASGSEVDIGKIEMDTSTIELVGIRPALPTLVAKNISSGTRLSIKHDATSSPERYGVTLIGIP